MHRKQVTYESHRERPLAICWEMNHYWSSRNIVVDVVVMKTELLRECSSGDGVKGK